MFTGIITELGKIAKLQQVRGGVYFTINAPSTAAQLAVNDSIAINGVCLTVIGKGADTFTVEAVEETLSKTTLGSVRANTVVNLELAMQLNQRVGGHLVLGHVDGVGVVRSVLKRESSWLFTVEIPDQFLAYVIPVGSIAIDGVSLTVARLEDGLVTVSIIPHTLENTTFQFLKEGSPVNIELDIIGKYIHRLMTHAPPDSPITVEKLREWGYRV